MKVFASIATALLGFASLLPFAQAQDSSVVDVAIVLQLDTLVAAVQFAGLESALRDEDATYTVFAPTEDAFVALPDGLLDTLLTEEGKPILSLILLYHVLPFEVFAADLSDGLPATTLADEDIVVSIGDDIKINDSIVLATDVPASNGVVHIIDAVLIPPSLTDEPSEPTEPTDAPQPDIVDTAVAAGFSTLVTAVEFAGLVDALKAPEPLKTVFAPTNEAFSALDPELLGFLLTDEGKDTLITILLYHVVAGKTLSTGLSDGLTITTLATEDVTVSISDAGIFINDSQVVSPDIEVSNGVIHVIDAVLVPPSLRAPPNIVEAAIASGFDTLVAAVQFAELVDALAAPEPLKTVFAPTNEAFAALDSETFAFLLTDDGKQTLIDILLYHVVGSKALSTTLSDGQEIGTLLGENVVVSINDDGIFIDESKVIAADIEVSNGVIHVIDTVLTPPSLRPLPNIVETAIAAGFDLLVGAVIAADLVGPLADPEPLKTVFAPTNDAFLALGDDLLTFLLSDDGIPTLTTILLYHVVGVQVFAADLSDGLEIVSLSGEVAIASVDGDSIKIDDSNVIQADIATSNGVIHVIDAVLIPPSIRLGNLVEVAIENGFDTLVAAVAAAGLVEALEAEEPAKTVFAPTNEAFAALGDEILGFLLTDAGIPALTEVLLYHVVGAEFPSDVLFDGLTITTLQGGDVTVIITEDAIKINNSSTVVAVDVPASNGIVHVIDAVLIPPGFAVPADIPGTAIAAGGFDTLVAALIATDLVGAVSFPNGPFTVFAPTDDAFAALPFGVVQLLLKEENLPVLSDILLYHVVSGQFFSTDLSDGLLVPTLFGANVTVSFRGSSLFINDSEVVAADIAVTNGVIHAIDAVLLFEGVVVPVPDADIVETAIAAGFGTLVAAVTAADLVGALQAESPIKTVFAPTDEAFAALPADILGYLLTDNGKSTLSDILLYHVVGQPIFAADLFDGAVVTTLLGEDVTVSIEEDAIEINESVVLATDIITTNGVIHVIDAVLLQPSLFTGDIPGTAIAAGGFDTLVAALSATGLVDAVAFPNGPFTVFAPTDEAFAKFPFGLLQSLLSEDGLPLLTDILLYHVVAGALKLSDIRNGERIETLLGDTVVFRNRDGPVINKSNIVAADIVTSNGIVHAIDAVLLLDEFDLPLPGDNIVEVAIDNGFNTLVAAVAFAGLADALADESAALTVFAPTDEAFAALPEDLLGFYLGAGVSILTDILLYHVVAEPIFAEQLFDGQNITTLEGTTVTVSIGDDGIFINDSEVIATNVVASNGVVHAIDAVLLQDALFTGDIPGTAVGAGIFNTLVAALGEADLVGALTFPNGPFTVFAPTDEAFAALPGDVLESLLVEEGIPLLTDILLYHVVAGVALAEDLSDGQEIETLFGDTVEVSIEGDDLFINDSKVVAADIITSNGVVHAIDAVLLFEGLPFTVKNIVETAISAGFDTLVAAVAFADLVGALEAEAPLKTVFAPTDEAFAALPEGIFNFLLTAAGKSTLTDILLYHVVGEQILAADLFDGAVVTTLLGEDVTVSIDGDVIEVNDSVVLATDVLATNGVIHVIDAVLLQPSLFETDIPSTASSAGLSTLVAALGATDLAGAVAFPNGPFTVFAPTNEAFAALGDVLEDLLEDEGLPVLADILLYHVVSGAFLLADLRNGERPDTLFGQNVVVRKRDTNIVNMSTIVQADVITSNGVVHVIDEVLTFIGLELP